MKDKKSSEASGAPVTKTGFILSFPESTPAGEVVAKGKEKGLAFSEKYVWAIRSSARRKGGGGRRAARSAAPRAVAPGRRGPGRPRRTAAAPAAASGGGGGGGSAERQFLTLVLDIGLRRAEELMSGIRARLAAVAAS